MHTDMRPTFYVEKYYTDISKERTTDIKYIDNMEGTSMTPVRYILFPFVLYFKTKHIHV